MPGSLVHNIRRRRVFDVMDLAHVARDDQHPVSLKFHERRRRDKAVHSHRAPANFRQNIVHLLNTRYAIERNAGVEEPLEINFVRVLLQEKNVLAHDKSPDCMIDRSVIVVALIDCKLQQMFGTTCDGPIVIADTAFRFHSGTPRSENITYDSFGARARMFARRHAKMDRLLRRRCWSRRALAPSTYRPEGGPSPWPTRST